MANLEFGSQPSNRPNKYDPTWVEAVRAGRAAFDANHTQPQNNGQPAPERSDENSVRVAGIILESKQSGVADGLRGLDRPRDSRPHL